MNGVKDLFVVVVITCMQICSWIIATGRLIFTIWNIILVVLYLKQRKRKKNAVLITEEIASHNGDDYLRNPVDVSQSYQELETVWTKY